MVNLYPYSSLSAFLFGFPYIHLTHSHTHIQTHGTDIQTHRRTIIATDLDHTLTPTPPWINFSLFLQKEFCMYHKQTMGTAFGVANLPNCLECKQNSCQQ